MVRFLLLNAFIAIHTVLFCLWAFLLIPFDRDGRRIHFLAAVPWAKVILKVSGISVAAAGKENVDEDVPRIYMTNHQSYFDIFALLAHLPVDFKFIMKQELMGIPILGPAMRRAGYVGIARDDPRKAVESMKTAAEKIRHGVSVVIFPEGTRSKDGRLLPFKRGGFNLALRSECDIVPIAIRNSYRIVPKGSLKVNRGAMGLRIGQPIPVQGYTRKNVIELIERVREAIEGMMVQESTEAEAPFDRERDFKGATVHE
jgi:1-acyl-sn-glycerol-3-phosphate acyltransferase